VYEDTNCIAVRSIWVGPIDISFEKLRVLLFDVLGGDDDFDLFRLWITVWLAN
jgi:hypothetical protein